MTIDYAGAQSVIERYGAAWAAFDGDSLGRAVHRGCRIPRGPLRAAAGRAQRRQGILAASGRAQEQVDFTVERHWVVDPTILVAWHASYVARRIGRTVRLAGFMTLEMREGGSPGCGSGVDAATAPRDRGGKAAQMAGDVSFDVVSDFDEQELRNALDQVRREVQQRFDFKGVTVDLTQAKEEIVLLTDDEHRRLRSRTSSSRRRSSAGCRSRSSTGARSSRPAATRSARRSRSGGACPTTWRRSSRSSSATSSRR